MKKKLIILNSIGIFLTLAIILSCVLYFLNFLRKTKNYVGSLADSFLPNLSVMHYKNILYPKGVIKNLNVKNNFNYTFFTACLMSCYNISFGYNPEFPKEITLEKRLGNSGFLLNYGKWNIFCFRGTIEGKEIFTDIDSVQTSFIDLSGNTYKDLQVHRGFHSIWMTALHDLNSCLHKENCIFIGHSLGGVIAHLASCAFYLKTEQKFPTIIFGSPKVGNRNIAKLIDTVSIYNENDLIPSLPPSVFTISEMSCYYSSYSSKIAIDVQAGNIFKNHSLGVYSFGVCKKFISDVRVDMIW